ncbi:MAG: hypothetical protein IJ899_03125 [Blautia sp.]|nr:hypothetical protein [Blautia sp.]
MENDISREELLAKIEELERENAMLKKLNEKVDGRYALPDRLRQKYNAKKYLRSAARVDLPFMYHSDIQFLSQMIRRICFPEKLIKNKLHPNGIFSVISLKDMTDEEYTRYTDILDKVLEPFMKNAAKETGGVEKMMRSEET